MQDPHLPYIFLYHSPIHNPSNRNKICYFIHPCALQSVDLQGKGLNKTEFWWPELFHQWLSCRSMKLTTHLHILLRLRITGAIILLPHTASYLTFIHSVFYLTTGPKLPLKRFLHIVRSRASSFK
jgi:hypothetical protein